jgi:hypothetical protein
VVKIIEAAVAYLLRYEFSLRAKPFTVFRSIYKVSALP